jgi:ATP-binding cassette subfamily B protein
VILDEPFRGLGRDVRRRLLRRVRRRWPGATVLCITHDVEETLDFDRVVILERGRVAEVGAPSRLASVPGSRYRALLDTERAVGEEVWSAEVWRRLRLERGRLAETRRGVGSSRNWEGNGDVRHRGDVLAG